MQLGAWINPKEPMANIAAIESSELLNLILSSYFNLPSVPITDRNFSLKL